MNAAVADAPTAVSPAIAANDALARDPQRLAGLKAHLRATQSTSALCDADAFTRNLEAIYTSMWRQAQLGGARDALSGAAA